MDPNDLWKILLLVLCLVLSAFFSGSETAYVALSRVRLTYLVNINRPGARRVSRLIERPERLLATVLLGNNLVNTGAAALATALAISLVDSANLAVLLATAGTTVALLVFGETVPKTLAWNKAESVAFKVAHTLVVVGWVLSPAVRLLQWLGTTVGRVLGVSSIHTQVTEEEIRTMISMGAKAGAVEPGEAELLEKVFSFGDSQVQEIMTPRIEIRWVEKGTTLHDFLNIYGEQTYTRFPVFDGDMENVVGVLSVKDMVQSMSIRGTGLSDTVTEILRPAYFVPETKLVGSLFSELRQAGQQMAIVVDQFGGVSGLVTLKRLLEVIVGPVGEEGEPAREEFASVGENVFEVDAGMAVQEANEEMSLDIPEGSYQTLAGFILDRLGHIPEEGEQLYFRNLFFEITEMKRLKIERVRIRGVAQAVEQLEG